MGVGGEGVQVCERAAYRMGYQEERQKEGEHKATSGSGGEKAAPNSKGSALGHPLIKDIQLLGLVPLLLWQM